MNYVHAVSGKVVTYPYSYSQLRRDNPDTSFPADPGDWLGKFDVYPVAETTRPEVVPLDKNLAEGAPELVGGKWNQTWVLVDATPEQIERRNKAAAQDAELSNAKLDAWIVQFLAMTPSGAQTHINNNSATLAALRTNVARMAYALRVLVRREMDQ